jgi:RNA polymerase sigma factor (sigma-70 family)
MSQTDRLKTGCFGTGLASPILSGGMRRFRMSNHQGPSPIANTERITGTAPCETADPSKAALADIARTCFLVYDNPPNRHDALGLPDATAARVECEQPMSEATGFLLVQSRTDMLGVARAWLSRGIRDQAEDVVSDAILTVVAKSASLDDPARIRGYLRGTVINKARNENRKHHRFRQLINAVSIDTDIRGEALFAKDELIRDNLDLFSFIGENLSQAEHEFFVLYFVDTLTIREIAARLGIKPATARKRESRLVMRIREIMAAPPDPPAPKGRSRRKRRGPAFPQRILRFHVGTMSRLRVFRDRPDRDPLARLLRDIDTALCLYRRTEDLVGSLLRTDAGLCHRIQRNSLRSPASRKWRCLNMRNSRASIGEDLRTVERLCHLYGDFCRRKQIAPFSHVPMNTHATRPDATFKLKKGWTGIPFSWN